MTSITLTAVPDGPDRVGGPVTTFDREGKPIPDRGAPVFLCRGGRSADTLFWPSSRGRAAWKEDA